ncbi:MAG TPA: pseudouridine synthase, partial [Usitatibacteraceae bacterium]|nr:pseudouridine synthase [Usitatibacteraceae bacterium]
MIKRVVVTKGLKARGYVDGRYVGEDKRETAREELLGKRRGKPAAGAKKRGGKRGGVVDGNTIAAAGKKARRGRGPATAQDAFFRADGGARDGGTGTAGAPPRKGRDLPRRNRAGKKTPFRPAFGATSASPSEVAEMRRMGGEARSGQFAEALAAQANVKRERLHKVLAQSGLGSRRDMEIMISSGRVMVNGIVATTGTQVGADDKVLVDHRPVVLKFNDELPRVLLYNKPEGEIVTTDDPGNRITVFDNLPKVEHGKWINIGRLDINTSGLLIFTTSGELANRFMHPRYEVEREYAVRLLGELSDEQRERLLAGVAIDETARAADEDMQDEDPEEGGHQPFAHDEAAAFVASGLARFERIERREGEEGEGANHWYHVVLKEGRNREVRRMFEAVGLTVSRLIRTRFGSISLPPRLKRGMLLELTPDEVRR